MTSHDDRVAVGLRIPRELHSWLLQRAKIEHRSLNAQMLWLLEQARDDDPHQQPQPPRKRPTGPRR